MTFFHYILHRARRHWQLLLTLILGVLLSTALLAAAPVLVNTVVEFGLRRTLLSADPLVGNLRLQSSVQNNEAGFQALNSEIQTIVQRRLSGQLVQIVPSAVSRGLTPWLEGQPLPDQRVLLGFYGLEQSDIAAQVEFVAGGWAEAVSSSELPVSLVQVVIGQEMATAYNLQVGDQLPLSLEQSAAEPTHQLDIAGIVRPLHPQSPYWFGEFSPLRAQSDERWSAQYIVLLPASQFFAQVDSFLPTNTLQLNWHILLAPERFTNSTLTGIQVNLTRLREDLRPFSPTVLVNTSLDTVLTNFVNQSSAVRAPLYFLSAEVVLLTLYYVIMVAALAVRQVEREFAVLQSRGASAGQIFRIQAGEAVLIALLALFSGPFLAVALVRGMTIVGPLADVSQPEWALSLPQTAWLAASAAAIACVAGLLLPVRPAIQRSIVAYQQGAIRSEKAPFWQRYYLDVFVLAIGLVLLWRLHFYGSLVGGTAVRPRVDWLLLLSPVALLIGSGTILLRLFPLFLTILAKLAAGGRGLAAALAMWQAARNPNHAARLVLLLTLAIALGILTTGINATLDASELERAQYTAGSDVRLVSKRAVTASGTAELPNITASTTLWRNSGSLSIGRDYLRFDVLAIDPASFAPITHYRQDFAAQAMPELLNTLLVEQETRPTLPLPGQPIRLAIWVWSQPDDPEDNLTQFLAGDSNLDRLKWQAKIQTAQHEMLTVQLEPSEITLGWRYFEAELPRLSAGSYPLELESLWLQNIARTEGEFSSSAAVFFQLAVDDITVVDAETAESTVAYGFEDLTTIWQLSEVGYTTSWDSTRAHSGGASQRLELFLDSRQSLALRLVSDQQPGPLPALVSPAFLAQTESAVGDVLNASIDSQPVELQVMGAVNYFPTLYEDLNAGYIITNRDVVLDYLNSFSSRAVNSNEALLAITPGISPQAVSEAALAQIPGLSQTWEAETVRLAIKADPMALGLRSVTYFGYVLTTALSLVGFATYFYMSARQKEAIYAVLRSIGMSPTQLYGSLVLEQVLLILTGLAIGTVLGVALNQLTLPGLPITFGDRPPTPPFIARNDWWGIGRIYLTLAIAFFLSLGIATTLLWRTQLHRVLRVGEE